jgi:flagellar P-ring protein precursor FlgI
VGVISEGGIVEKNANYLREHDRARLNSGKVNLILKNPDYIQARNLQKAINESFNLSKAALALDPGTVAVDLSMLMQRYEYDTPMELMGEIENLPLETDLPARVIVSERTGVVISGGDAKLSAVDIVQGDLRVVIKPAQPDQIIEEGKAEITETGGDIRQGPSYRRVPGEPPQTLVSEGDKTLVQLEEGNTVGNLIRAISGGELETSPRDIIAILQALDRMGALHAQLIFVEK